MSYTNGFIVVFTAEIDVYSFLFSHFGKMGIGYWYIGIFSLSVEYEGFAMGVIGVWYGVLYMR